MLALRNSDPTEGMKRVHAMHLRALPLAALLALLASCAKPPVTPSSAEPLPFGPTGIPPQLRARGPAGDSAGTPVAAPEVTPEIASRITPEQEISFTNPDDPDGGIPEMSAVIRKQVRESPLWERSEGVARRRASREGRPLLIWFTDSARSPMCKALAQELFDQPDFKAWSKEHLICLKVDDNIDVKDPDLSLDEEETRRTDLRNYAARLKKQYKVLGQPDLVLVHPSGNVIGRYRGYRRGEADYTWGLIKQGEAAFSHTHREWRKGMEKKGYRDWSDRSGRKVFARLVRYAGGTLVLVEPDGTLCRTREEKLSDGDRAWIAEQRKIRGL